MDEHALAAGVALNVCYQQNAPLIVRSLVDQGLACTVANVAQAAGRQGELPRFIRRIVQPEVTRVATVAWWRNRPLSKPAECVRDSLFVFMIEAVESGDWCHKAGSMGQCSSCAQNIGWRVIVRVFSRLLIQT